MDTLYKLFEDKDANPWGLDRSSLQNALRVPEREMDANVMFLERKGLVKLTQASNVLWFRAKITSFGKEVFANKKRYEEEFSFVTAGDSEGKIESPE